MVEKLVGRWVRRGVFELREVFEAEAAEEARRGTAVKGGRRVCAEESFGHCLAAILAVIDCSSN